MEIYPFFRPLKILQITSFNICGCFSKAFSWPISKNDDDKKPSMNLNRTTNKPHKGNFSERSSVWLYFKCFTGTKKENFAHKITDAEKFVVFKKTKFYCPNWEASMLRMSDSKTLFRDFLHFRIDCGGQDGTGNTCSSIFPQFPMFPENEKLPGSFSDMISKMELNPKIVHFFISAIYGGYVGKGMFMLFINDAHMLLMGEGCIG